MDIIKLCLRIRTKLSLIGGLDQSVVSFFFFFKIKLFKCMAKLSVQVLSKSVICGREAAAWFSLHRRLSLPALAIMRPKMNKTKP